MSDFKDSKAAKLDLPNEILSLVETKASRFSIDTNSVDYLWNGKYMIGDPSKGVVLVAGHVSVVIDDVQPISPDLKNERIRELELALKGMLSLGVESHRLYSAVGRSSALADTESKIDAARTLLNLPKQYDKN